MESREILWALWNKLQTDRLERDKKPHGDEGINLNKTAKLELV